VRITHKSACEERAHECARRACASCLRVRLPSPERAGRAAPPALRAPPVPPSLSLGFSDCRCVIVHAYEDGEE
jgi:hypothetical protein